MRGTIRGDGILICGEVQTSVVYILFVIDDELGNRLVVGRLHNVDVAVAVIASKSGPCRLLLQDGMEVVVNVTQADDRGNAHIKSSGPVPDL